MADKDCVVEIFKVDNSILGLEENLYEVFIQGVNIYNEQFKESLQKEIDNQILNQIKEIVKLN